MQTPMTTYLQQVDQAVISHRAGRSARDGFARLQAQGPRTCCRCHEQITGELAIVISTGTYCSQSCLWDGLN